MNWQFLLEILALMQIIQLSENSHVQLAEQQQEQQHQQQLQLQAEVNASIGHLPSLSSSSSSSFSATALPSLGLEAAKNQSIAQRRSTYYQPSFAPRQNFHHWHNGQRIHRVYNSRAYSHHPPPNRWMTRRHRQPYHRHHHPPHRHYHHDHHLFSQWSPWSPCSPDCHQRKERHCKVKRKCGHTKHIEERKCWRCHPIKFADSHEWTKETTSSSLPPHVANVAATTQQQQQQQSTPNIIINAAAAAATGPITATSSVAQPQQQATPHVVAPSTDINIHHPVAKFEESPRHFEDEVYTQHYPPEHQHQHHQPAHNHFDDDDDVDYNHSTEEDEDDGHDFYVIKAKRKRKIKRKKPSNWHHTSADSADYYIEEEPNEHVPAATRFRSQTDSQIDAASHAKKIDLRPGRSRGGMPIGEEYDARKVKAGSSSLRSADYDQAGDIFQYDDFDIDRSDPNQYDDLSYEDAQQVTANASSNPIWEKATPDHLIPRHRRVYSKWSRWTKCSPKCTTRRYKKCRLREQCGREVLREIAYCYTEGSFCQQWLQAQVQKNPPYELKPLGARRRDISGGGAGGAHHDGGGALSNSIVSDFIMNGKGYRGPEYTAMKLKCGIAPIRNNKRNLYNMLKIIGGKAARKGEWPWQVAIFNRFKEAFCGGTLIAPEWVVTAAHCVRKVLYVRIGEHNLDYEDGTELQLRVLKSFKHPNFDKKTVDSDVALLRLPKPINTTTYIGFSCLPKPYQPLPKNMDCTVIGWGKRRNRDMAGTSVLHQAEVPIIPMDNCRSVYHDYTITKNMFCAGHKRGRIDTCAGDSGGPLLCRDITKPNHPWTIFGITSFGDGCAKRNKFGIYAKVPNYVDWIWSVINCNGNCKMYQRNGF